MPELFIRFVKAGSSRITQKANEISVAGQTAYRLSRARHGVAGCRTKSASAASQLAQPCSLPANREREEQCLV